jgi:hypothetical protein
MFNRIKELTYNAFTGADNKSLDIGRILWTVGSFFYFGLSVYDISMGGKFIPMDWATGFGVVLAAGGAALGMKANAEPKQIIKKDDGGE